MDELAGEPETVASIREMGPRDPAVADRAAGEPFIEPSNGVFGGRKRLSLLTKDFNSRNEFRIILLSDFSGRFLT